MVYPQTGLENRFLAPLLYPAFSYGAAFRYIVSYEGSKHSVCSTDVEEKVENKIPCKTRVAGDHL